MKKSRFTDSQIIAVLKQPAYPSSRCRSAAIDGYGLWLTHPVKLGAADVVKTPLPSMLGWAQLAKPNMQMCEGARCWAS